MSSNENRTTALSATDSDKKVAVAVDDCWSRIGVSGDGSCKELETHVHCRNCPVYADAGARLLDRSLTPEYRREWALYFSRPKFKASPGGISEVIFRIGREWLALPTSAFQEVIETRKVHTIPHRRQSALIGLINVRGELLLAVSLARLLGMVHDERSKGDRTTYERLLVASWQSHRVVFPVDEVHGVHRFDAEQLREPPATLSKTAASYTQGVLPWEGKIVSCLDADLLFPALSESIA